MKGYTPTHWLCHVWRAIHLHIDYVMYVLTVCNSENTGTGYESVGDLVGHNHNRCHQLSISSITQHVDHAASCVCKTKADC